MGIRRLGNFNSTLLGKWLWRYGTEIEALWRRVIEAKYGNIWGGWCTKKVTTPYGVSLWRYIRSGWLNFSKLLVYDVGDGTRVKFWKHVWCGDCTLKRPFRSFTVLVGQRIPRWLKLWVGLLGGFTRMCNFVVHHKIGKKKPLTGLWGWSILRQCRGLAQIRFVRNLQGVEVLRLEVIIAPFTLLILFPFHGK